MLLRLKETYQSKNFLAKMTIVNRLDCSWVCWLGISITWQTDSFQFARLPNRQQNLIHVCSCLKTIINKCRLTTIRNCILWNIIKKLLICLFPFFEVCRLSHSFVIISKHKVGVWGKYRFYKANIEHRMKSGWFGNATISFSFYWM